MSKFLGVVKLEDVFIRGQERITGTNKMGSKYDFLEIRFDDSTGEDFALRAEEETAEEDFPKRREGTLIANLYGGKGKQGMYYYLKAAGFEETEEKETKSKK